MADRNPIPLRCDCGAWFRGERFKTVDGVTSMPCGVCKQVTSYTPERLADVVMTERNGQAKGKQR